jgi:hypothetical protein
MVPDGARRRHRSVALLVTTLVLVGGVGPAAATALGAAPDPAAWTTRLCTEMVDVQSAALDARATLWAATATAPADPTAQKAAVTTLRTALAPVRARLAVLDRTLARPAPRGRNTTAVRDALRSGLVPVADAFATAAGTTPRLSAVAPAGFPRATAATLATLDRALDRATPPLTRVERTVRASPIGDAVAAAPICRPLGFEWSMLPTPAGATATPAAPATTPDVPGSADVGAPKLLLPGRYRPTAEVAALAAASSMTGRSRTFFYGAMPVVETGSAFVGDCPTSDSADVQILGCFHEGRIYILAVTQPDLARVVTVTAAHEMLHAVYDALSDDARAKADALTSAFFASTTAERLERIVAQYDARAPENRANELHSLIPTQVATLTPELDAYYAPYFRDRGPVLAAYQQYVTLFEGLFSQYDALKGQIDDLRARIADLRTQSDVAAAEANRLGGQIDALRAQGRIADANALVPAQNDAVRRAQGLNGAANGLIDDYNALVDRLNAVAAQLGGLESALRPLG